MKKEGNLQNEWEGFEHFHDHHEPNYIELPDINRIKANHHKDHKEHHHSYHFQPKIHKIANKSNYPNRKKSQPKSEFMTQHSNDNPKLTKNSISPNKVVEMGEVKEVREVKKVQSKRYERIPIIRYEEDYKYSGKVIYKNFIPKNSDNYMRILKEVDWQNPSEKKRSIRNLHGIEFNSQFEGGNLNVAIQGFRVVV